MDIIDPQIKPIKKYNFVKKDPYIEKENSNYNRNRQLTSRFGNERILNDPSINKYYNSYLSIEERKIRESKKIIQLLDQIDNKKNFEIYKNELLKESHAKKNSEKKNNILYTTNYVNLDNFKQKLEIQNKINSQDGQFMLSLMSHLGSRSKKIVKQKIYHKLEALSKQKRFIKRKSVEFKSSSNSKRSKRNSLVLLFKNGFINPYQINDKKKFNLNNDNESKNHSNLNLQLVSSQLNSPEIKIVNKNIYNTNYNNIKTNLNINSNINEVNEFDLMKQNLNNINGFNQTSSTNFGQTKYNKTFFNFNINQESKKSIHTNNDNLSVHSNTSKKSNSERMIINNQKSNKSVKKNFELPQKKNSSSVINNIINNKNNNNTKVINFNNINNNSSSNSINSDEKSNSIEENKNSEKTKNREKSIIINEYNSKNYGKTEQNSKKTLRRCASFSSSDDSSSKKLKIYDKNLINKKLNKKYKDTMNDFIQQIKNEEKDIRSNIILMSSKLFTVKKEHQKLFCVNDNIYKNEIKSYSKKKNSHINKIKKSQLNKKIEAEIGNTDYYAGKSKYSIPKINKVIYGKNENVKDQFEKIQDELLREVRKQYKKIKSTRKRGRIIGKEILDKITAKNYGMKIID